jgi:hypothetical protein
MKETLVISATEANKLRSNIQQAIRSIGSTSDTKLPTTKSNQGPAALQYWLMSFISKLVHGMMEEAKRKAILDGVLFDHKTNPLPQDTEKQIFTSDVVNVSVKVSKAAKRLDDNELKRQLRKRHVKQEIIDASFEASMKPSNPAHNFSAVLVEKPK